MGARKTDASPEARLTARLVRAESGCLEWTGHTVDGYGRLNVDGRATLAHRFAWTLSYGPIPPSMDVLHHCDNRPCCEPTCLFLGTNHQNVLDKMAKGRHQASRITHCPQDHEYTEANTYLYRGKRSCRQCRRDAGARYRAKNRKARP